MAAASKPSGCWTVVTALGILMLWAVAAALGYLMFGGE